MAYGLSYVLIVILVILALYILWDRYVHSNTLTKLASSVDNLVDKTKTFLALENDKPSEEKRAMENDTQLPPLMEMENVPEMTPEEMRELQALQEAGVVPVEMEGSLDQPLDNVVAADDDEDSQSAELNDNSSEENDQDNDNVVENFIYTSYPHYCENCGYKGRIGCNNCSNCGYCITPSGNGECVSGDANGPYFRDDCVAYEYSNSGTRVYSNSPYRYLLGIPSWRTNRYYYDFRGYPRKGYVKRRHSGTRPYGGYSGSRGRSYNRTSHGSRGSGGGSRSRSGSRSHGGSRGSGGGSHRR